MDFFVIGVFLLFSYLFASIPFGVIIGKKLKGIDIREYGSGNIGAANAFRVLGFWGGLLVLLLDILKGLLPVCLSKYVVSAPMIPYLQVLSGIFAILGHNFSFLLKFKGGKGIATSFGVIIALDWQIAIICFLAWGLIVISTKYSSLGSVIGSLMLPIMMLLWKKPIPYVFFAVIACISAFYSLRENLKRLIKGKELKINEKSDKEL